MIDSTKRSIANQIRRVLTERSWSAAQLAREAGVSPSTITRALDPAVAFVPSTRTLEKLSRYFSSHNEEFKSGISTNAGAALSGFDSLYRHISDVSGKYNLAPIVGIIQPGTWELIGEDVSGIISEIETNDHLRISAPGIPSGVVTFRFRSRRPDADFRDGDLILVELYDPATPIASGELILLRRNLIPMALSEMTLATAVPAIDGVIGLSRDGSGERLFPAARDDMTSTIVGTVRGSLRVLS